jgi:hypothetical protein
MDIEEHLLKRSGKMPQPFPYDQEVWLLVANELMMKKVKILKSGLGWTEGFVNDIWADFINIRTINVQVADLSLIQLKQGEYVIQPH